MIRKFCQYTSYILSFLYTYFVRLFNRRIVLGGGTILYFKSHCINMSKKGSITIGRNCSIGCGKRGYHAGLPFYTSLLNDGHSSKIIIGDNCRINGAYIHSQAEIRIGNNCVIASNVNIMDSNGHETISKDRTVGRDIPLKIVIGNNVWIGINCIILKGSHIGDNSIIGAGCVVKGYVPNNCIVRAKTNRICKIKNV